MATRLKSFFYNTLLVSRDAAVLITACAAFGLTSTSKAAPKEISQTRNKAVAEITPGKKSVTNSETESSTTPDKKKTKETESSPNTRKNRKGEHFDFPYPSNLFGWAGETGRLSIWINGDWKLKLPGGETLPIRYRFYGAQDRAPDKIMGGEWWFPLLESTILQTSEQNKRVTTLGGRSKYLSSDPKNKNRFQTKDRQWTGLSTDGGRFVMEGPGGWRYHYVDKRLVKVITPSGNTLIWNLDKNNRVKSITTDEGDQLLSVQTNEHGLVKEIKTHDGLEFRFKDQPYPATKSASGDEAHANAQHSTNHISEILPDGESGREFIFNISADSKHKDILKMEYSRVIPNKKTVKENFSWQVDSGLIKSDSESQYSKAKESGNNPRQLTRKFSNGGQEIYRWNNKTSVQYRERRDGSSYKTFYVKKAGPSYFKVNRVIRTRANGEVEDFVSQFDKLGRRIRTEKNGVLNTRLEYSVSNGENVQKLFMKLSSPDPDSEDGLTLTTTTYSSLENGRKLRTENQGRVTEYDSQGHIVKVTKDGVLIRGKNNEPPIPAPKKEPLLVKKYTPPTDATTSGWILSPLLGKIRELDDRASLGIWWFLDSIDGYKNAGTKPPGKTASDIIYQDAIRIRLYGEKFEAPFTSKPATLFKKKTTNKKDIHFNHVLIEKLKPSPLFKELKVGDTLLAKVGNMKCNLIIDALTIPLNPDQVGASDKGMNPDVILPYLGRQYGAGFLSQAVGWRLVDRAAEWSAGKKGEAAAVKIAKALERQCLTEIYLQHGWCAEDLLKLAQNTGSAKVDAIMINVENRTIDKMPMHVISKLIDLKQAHSDRSSSESK